MHCCTGSLAPRALVCFQNCWEVTSNFRLFLWLSLCLCDFVFVLLQPEVVVFCCQPIKQKTCVHSGHSLRNARVAFRLTVVGGRVCFHVCDSFCSPTHPPLNTSINTFHTHSHPLSPSGLGKPDNPHFIATKRFAPNLSVATVFVLYWSSFLPCCFRNCISQPRDRRRRIVGSFKIFIYLYISVRQGLSSPMILASLFVVYALCPACVLLPCFWSSIRTQCLILLCTVPYWDNTP